MSTINITRLTPANAAEYRLLMLNAYASAPDAFTSTVAEREVLPLSWWQARVSDLPASQEQVIGAFVDAKLVGVAGLSHESRERTRHKAALFGMFVLPQYRGRGIARELVLAVLDAARAIQGTQVVQLTVTDSNTAAVQLYQSCGFVGFGTEPMAVKLDDQFVSKLHMWYQVNKSEC